MFDTSFVPEPTSEELHDFIDLYLSTPHSAESWTLRQSIIAYSLSAIFKDCSIFITCPLIKDGTGWRVIETETTVKVIDLDLKPITNMRKWFDLDEEIWRHWHNTHMATPPDSPETTGAGEYETPRPLKAIPGHVHNASTDALYVPTPDRPVSNPLESPSTQIPDLALSPEMETSSTRAIFSRSPRDSGPGTPIEVAGPMVVTSLPQGNEEAESRNLPPVNRVLNFGSMADGINQPESEAISGIEPDDFGVVTSGHDEDESPAVPDHPAPFARDTIPTNTPKPEPADITDVGTDQDVHTPPAIAADHSADIPDTLATYHQSLSDTAVQEVDTRPSAPIQEASYEHVIVGHQDQPDSDHVSQSIPISLLDTQTSTTTFDRSAAPSPDTAIITSQPDEASDTVMAAGDDGQRMSKFNHPDLAEGSSWAEGTAGATLDSEDASVHEEKVLESLISQPIIHESSPTNAPAPVHHEADPIEPTSEALVTSTGLYDLLNNEDASTSTSVVKDTTTPSLSDFNATAEVSNPASEQADHDPVPTSSGTLPTDSAAPTPPFSTPMPFPNSSAVETNPLDSILIPPRNENDHSGP